MTRIAFFIKRLIGLYSVVDPRVDLASNCPIAGADPGFFAGGGQRRPCTAGAFGVRADGGSRVDKHQIKVHSVHRIFRAIFFDFFFLAS